MITIGSLYAMAPRALDRPAMHSRVGMEIHFWLHTIGVLLYTIAMWTAGAIEGQMWRATNADGSLKYPFIDSLIAIKPFYMIRVIGGLLIVAGMFIMAWNLWHTAAHARTNLIKPDPVQIPEPVADQVPAPLPATS